MAEAPKDLTDDERDLLSRWRDFYVSLASGKREPSTPKQKHFVAVISGRAKAETEHEIAFIKSRRLSARMSGSPDQTATRPSLPEEPGQKAYPSSMNAKFNIKYQPR